jgi:hypothetical protein
MTGEPDILRITPKGPITRPQIGLPVLATLHHTQGGELDVPATATAWTRDAVEIAWVAPGGGLTNAWVPAADVRRGKAAEERLKHHHASPE